MSTIEEPHISSLLSGQLYYITKDRFHVRPGDPTPFTMALAALSSAIDGVLEWLMPKWTVPDWLKEELEPWLFPDRLWTLKERTQGLRRQMDSARTPEERLDVKRQLVAVAAELRAEIANCKVEPSLLFASATYAMVDIIELLDVIQDDPVVWPLVALCVRMDRFTESSSNSSSCPQLAALQQAQQLASVIDDLFAHEKQGQQDRPVLTPLCVHEKQQQHTLTPPTLCAHNKQE